MKLKSKTLDLNGGETEVRMEGNYTSIRNDSSGMVYLAAEPGILPDAEGVVSIPVGDSVTVNDEANPIYVTGTGKVLLISSHSEANPFKTSAQSGSGADGVARAAISSHAANTEVHVTASEKSAWNAKADKSDIPASLPADGGNADTLGGRHESNFVENMLNQDMHFSLVWGDSNYITSQIDADIPAVPVLSNYVFILARNSEGKVMSALAIGADYTENIYVYQSGKWKKVNDNGNAATLGTHPASDFAMKSEYNVLDARITALESK